MKGKIKIPCQNIGQLFIPGDSSSMVMDAKLSVERQLNRFNYRRYECDSLALQKKSTFGVIYSLDCIRKNLPPLETIYFLHGGDGDDQQFVNANYLDFVSDANKGTLVDRRIQIVLPNIGLSYLKEPYDSHLMGEVMPCVEGETASAHVRHLYGISMGGTAAFNLFLKNSEKFKSVACHFPGLIDFNPFDDQQSKDFQNKAALSDEKMGILRWCYQTPFSDLADFKRNDPHVLLGKITKAQLKDKNIYWDCATQDDYGLQWGGSELSRKA